MRKEGRGNLVVSRDETENAAVFPPGSEPTLSLRLFEAFRRSEMSLPPGGLWDRGVCVCV